MTNRSKAKGTAAESAVVKYLRTEQGLPHVERRALSGVGDRGDIAGIPGVVIEVKSAETKKPMDWQAETLVEMRNDGASLCALVVRVKYKHPRDWDCWVPLWLLEPVKEMNLETPAGYCFWIRMSLAEFIGVLREEGYVI